MFEEECKPHTKNRDTAYRRYKSHIKAKRKSFYYKKFFGLNDEDMTPRALGKLRKGKPYCSCWMCNGSEKWNNTMNRGSLDKRKYDALTKEELKIYNLGE